MKTPISAHAAGRMMFPDGKADQFPRMEFRLYPDSPEKSNLVQALYFDQLTWAQIGEEIELPSVQDGTWIDLDVKMEDWIAVDFTFDPRVMAVIETIGPIMVHPVAGQHASEGWRTRKCVIVASSREDMSMLLGAFAVSV